MLVNNVITSIYNGVNQQPAELRLDTQVEEMINFYPTLNQGILKRNPTVKIETSSELIFDKDMFLYQYDRGDTLGNVEEKYAIKLTPRNIEIINLITGRVYKDRDGLQLSESARQYLFNTYSGRTGYACLTLGDTTFITNKIKQPSFIEIAKQPNTADYKIEGYFWIKEAEAVYGYNYSYRVGVEERLLTGTISGKSVNEVVVNLNNSLRNQGIANLTLEMANSILRVGYTPTINPDFQFTEFSISDDFGSQASSAWTTQAETLDTLPKNFPFSFILQPIKITGTAENSAAFYVDWNGKQWVESFPVGEFYRLDKSTMPHIITRQSDGTFTVDAYDNWWDKTVGYEEKFPSPSFLQVPIKDIFFTRNRLGFLTGNSVVLSEAANYGNFFRTTVITTLDSDFIDLQINATQSLDLEYASLLENNLLLISPTMQFKQIPTDVLTPNTLAFNPCSAYEINIKIRPIFMNNKLYAISKRGNYSAVLEFYINPNTEAIFGDDITSHVQSYIRDDITALSGSPINNMLFLSSNTGDTIWVYKYYDSGQQRIQSAWFKWQFNGDIYSAFTMDMNLYILIDRKEANAISNWVIGDGTWNSEKLWDSDKLWVSNSDSIESFNQFEKLDIFPQLFTEKFLDNGDTPIVSECLVGEWIPMIGDKKDFTFKAQMKTFFINCEDEGELFAFVNNIKRKTYRQVQAIRAMNKKVLLMGRATDLRIGMKSITEKGFKINGLSIEGEINNRARRI